MSRPAIAVMLAGGLRPSALRDQLGIPILCLPVSEQQTLLSLWLMSFAEIGGCDSLRIVVSAEGDAKQIRDQLEQVGASRRQQVSVEVMAERTRWRGTGGILRDVTEDLHDHQVVLTVEAACLPPTSLASLFDALGPDTVAAVGVGGVDEPAGVYAFRREALDRIPTIGFFDIKEQLLPALYDCDHGALSIAVTDRVVRIRDRATYLQALSTVSGRRAGAIGPVRRSASARISSSAFISGECIIGHGVIVENNAVVRNSVVLARAVIGARAVVSRSIIGPTVEIPPGTLVADAVAVCRSDRPGCTMYRDALAR